MTTFKTYLEEKSLLEEKRRRDVIVVDIQPMYQQWMDLDLAAFGNFLLQNNRILYFYNGTNTVGDDTQYDIIEMLYEATGSEELIEKLNSSDTVWIDKGYSFFRTWMDLGADVGFIQKAIRYMVMNRVNDSRDITPEEWLEKFPEDFQDYMEGDNIYLPDISIGQLKSYNGSLLTGGGKHQCLKEIQILMNTFNIKYTLVDKFIYG